MLDIPNEFSLSDPDASEYLKETLLLWASNHPGKIQFIPKGKGWQLLFATEPDHECLEDKDYCSSEKGERHIFDYAFSLDSNGFVDTSPFYNGSS